MMMTSITTAKRKKLLIVDDEQEIRSLLSDFLASYFEIETATNGDEAIKKAKIWQPEIMLMDVLMPVMNGMDACQAIRKDQSTRHIPIVMLTALDASDQRIKAFDLGADDFIAKPYDPLELISRLNSKLRRCQELQEKPQETLEIGNLCINIPKQEATIDGNIIELRALEYDILVLLMERCGEVITRKVIMSKIWNNTKKSDRLIDAHLTALREKIAHFNGEIQTVYGAGYRIKTD